MIEFDRRPDCNCCDCTAAEGKTTRSGRRERSRGATKAIGNAKRGAEYSGGERVQIA